MGSVDEDGYGNYISVSNGDGEGNGEGDHASKIGGGGGGNKVGNGNCNGNCNGNGNRCGGSDCNRHRNHDKDCSIKAMGIVGWRQRDQYIINYDDNYVDDQC